MRREIHRSCPRRPRVRASASLPNRNVRRPVRRPHRGTFDRSGTAPVEHSCSSRSAGRLGVGAAAAPFARCRRQRRAQRERDKSATPRCAWKLSCGRYGWKPRRAEATIASGALRAAGPRHGRKLAPVRGPRIVRQINSRSVQRRSSPSPRLDAELVGTSSEMSPAILASTDSNVGATTAGPRSIRSDVTHPRRGVRRLARGIPPADRIQRRHDDREHEI